MTKISNAAFKGASGNEYPFNVYPFNTTFKEVAAVYIVSYRHKKPTEGYIHTFIYIGQTDNLKERFENHHQANCFKENKANVICTHQEDDAKKRLEIESDLLKNYSSICND